MFNTKLKLIISQQQATIDQLTAQLTTNQQDMANYKSTITELQSQILSNYILSDNFLDKDAHDVI